MREARFQDHDLLADGPTVVGSGDLTIRVAGIQFDAPTSIRYRHRLRGLHDQWSEVTTANVLSWSDLPPGNYTFEAMARARDGVWSRPVSVSMERRPAWVELAVVRIGGPALALATVLGGLMFALLRSRARNRQLRGEIAQREQAEHELRWQQSENERVQGMLEASRRLEALGRLSGGIAHDFNNLLAAASGYAEPLTHHGDDEVVEAGGVIMEVIRRGSKLTGQLLSLGHRRDGGARCTDVGQALQSLAPMLRRLIRENIAVEVTADPRLYSRIELGLLEQIVTNLVTNARDAIEGPGRIDVSARPQMRNGKRWVLLDVTDNGRGLPHELRERIFDPYFTTKDMSRGTGLGLATVHRAVHEAGGRVEVWTTRVGQGTTMRVWLPQMQEEVPAETEERHQRLTLPPPLRVLVVDDDVYVMRATVRLLEKAGHTVLGASELDEAVRVARHNAVDILLTDVLLPNATGIDVRNAICAIHPELPVVFMTGHAGDLVDSLSDDVLVIKPFTAETLLAAIANRLK